MPLPSDILSELYTIRDFIRFAASRFEEAEVCYGHGTDSAWDEATHLVFQTLYLPPEGEKHALSARVTKAEAQKILHNINQRIDARLPTPYITQQAWLGEIPFYVDARVLIPRSPIFELIEDQFEPWVDPENVTNLLDLCTGSGALAILAAIAFENAEVDAVDISEEALSVAARNCERHGVEDEVNLIQSDLFSALKGKKYQVIFSNPPYVPLDEWQELPKEFHQEPALALKSGEDGLLHVRQILEQAADYLTDEGILVVEVGNAEDALIDAYPDAPFTWLEFEDSEVEGVFLLTREQLLAMQNMEAYEAVV